MSGKVRIIMECNWTGQIEGKSVHVKAGEAVDVPPEYAHALVSERQIARLATVEEILEQPQKKKSPKATQKGKAFKGPVKDKMVTEATATK